MLDLVSEVRKSCKMASKSADQNSRRKVINVHGLHWIFDDFLRKTI